MIRLSLHHTCSFAWPGTSLNRLLAALILPLCLQSCIMGQHGPEGKGLVPREPEFSIDVRRATLRWEPRVVNTISRLPGGSGRIVGGLDRDEPIENLRYDIEIYQKNPGSAAHERAKNDYTRLWRAFWTRPHAYDDGESDIERERAYKLIHLRQGIRDEEYVIPFDLEPGAIYAWRVRPVYRYKGQTVAEDWMRENIIVLFGFVSYANSIHEFITTSPPEVVLPPKTWISKGEESSLSSTPAASRPVN